MEEGSVVSACAFRRPTNDDDEDCSIFISDNNTTRRALSRLVQWSAWSDSYYWMVLIDVLILTRILMMVENDRQQQWWPYLSTKKILIVLAESTSVAHHASRISHINDQRERRDPTKDFLFLVWWLTWNDDVRMTIDDWFVGSFLARQIDGDGQTTH